MFLLRRKCQKILQKSVNDRINWTKSKTNLQYNKKKHNSLLHSESVKANIVKTSVENGENSGGGVKDNDQPIASTSNFVSALDNTVLFATALVGVKAKSGELIALRALIDQGFQSSFISEGAAQLLN